MTRTRSLTAYVLTDDAEARLHLGLVALGVRDVAHVVAEAADPELRRLVHADGGPHPGADAPLHGRVLPVTHDGLAGMAQARGDVGELAVAVR